MTKEQRDIYIASLLRERQGKLIYGKPTIDIDDELARHGLHIPTPAWLHDLRHWTAPQPEGGRS